MRRRGGARVGWAWAGVPVCEMCASGERAGGCGLGGELRSVVLLVQQVIIEQADDEERVIIRCVRGASSTQMCPAGRRPREQLDELKATASDAPEPPTPTEMTFSMLLDDSAMLLQRCVACRIMLLLCCRRTSVRTIHKVCSSESRFARGEPLDW